jgi:uncharacterized membrane protein YqaE (UPF0057 family)
MTAAASSSSATVNENPGDYIYVSKKHYERKVKVENDGTSIGHLLKNPGPVGVFMIYLFDTVIEFVTRISVYMFTFIGTGFNYVMAYTFGTFDGILPSSVTDSGGIRISYRFMRYIINLFLPPVGVFLSKGFYGWFNIFICFILTYIHYLLGIIYCFVITSSNRYSDLYERTELAAASTSTLDKPAKPAKSATN